MKAKLTFLMLLASLSCLAIVQIRPGLILYQGGNTYTIHYINEGYSARDTSLFGDNGHFKFSYIQFSPDYYDYVGDECAPMYPSYTLHLELPDNATNITLRVLSLDYTHVDLTYPYVPVQSSITGQPEIICYDSTLYSNNTLMNQYYQDWYRLSNSSYIRMTSRGINFSLYPVHYHVSGVADVLKEAKFEITFDGDRIEELYRRDDFSSSNFFDNYLDREFFHPEETPFIHGEPYLIITERQYEDSIVVFRHHKESLGYNVIVEYVDDFGSTPDQIRTRIITHYTNLQLKYVLLVGSLTAIPFSSGRDGHFTDPPTDIYYTCLDNLLIANQRDYHPHVYLGRWDVYDITQLSNVMRKTIKSENAMYLNNSHRIASFSGTDRPWVSYRDQAEWIETNVINASSYLSGQFFNGWNVTASTYCPYQAMKDQIENEEQPLWMFMYFGHGYWNYMAEPYRFFNSQINNCSNSDLPYQPFGFSFACYNGNLYKNSCFARDWLNVGNGGVGMMAATEKTIIECCKYYSRKLFSPIVEMQPTMTIGELIANAKERYYYADQVPYRRNHIAKFIYLGDPSLYIHGLDMHNYRHIAPISPSFADEEDTPYIVKVWSVNGLLVDEFLYSELEEHSYPNGVHIVQFLDQNNNVINVTKVVQ